MTSPRLTLNIPTPCQERWGAMMPTKGGRHCASCQKTVVDFSDKTDAEILAYLDRATSSSCGRFRPEQIGRPLVRLAPVSRWRQWLSAMLALTSTIAAGKVGAQPTNFISLASNLIAATPRGTTCASEQAEHTSTPFEEPIILRGTVVDASTGEALPGVTILLKGTSLGASTDANGNFELPIKTGNSRVTLLIRYVGYEPKEKTIKLKHLSGDLRLQLKLSYATLGEIAYMKSSGGFFQRITSFFLSA